MNFEIGKRYRWSPYRSGKKKWKNGILGEIFETHGMQYGKFITRDNEEWNIPLDADYLEEYRK